MLKSGSAPGLDGITSEHLKFLPCNPLYIHTLLCCSLCALDLVLGIVPDSFCSGLLVSIMKKANIDLTECKSYLSYNCVNCDVKK